MRNCRLFGCGLVFLVSALLACLLSVGVAGASREACRDGPRRLCGVALADGDVEAARRAYDTVWEEPGCDDVLRDQAGRAVSLLHARVAQERVTAGASLVGQRALLERGLAYARSWPLLALLADIAHDEKDFDGAAVLYQEALMVLDDPVETPQPPPEPEIERLVRRAMQSRLLAADYQPSPKTRAGDPGGLAATPHSRLRDRTGLLVPITFHTDSVNFTDKGLRAARGLGVEPDGATAGPDCHRRPYRSTRLGGVQFRTVAAAGGGGVAVSAHPGFHGRGRSHRQGRKRTLSGG